MGINHGVFHGVGQRQVVGQTFLGTMTVQTVASLINTKIQVQGLVIQAAPNQGGFLTDLFDIYSSAGKLVWSVPIAGGLSALNAKISAGTVANGFMRFDATTDPPSWQGGQGTRVYFGQVVMNHTNFPGITGAVGDLYIRQVSGSNHIYTCTVAGSPGTWTTVIV